MRFLKHRRLQSPVESVYIEEEIKKLGEKFQIWINLIPDPVVIVDGKGKFLAVNDRVEEKTGFRREELLGKNFLQTKIVTARSKAVLIRNLAKRMMGMHMAPYEIQGLTKDGIKLPFEINAAKIEYEGKRADLVIFRDITERKKAEKALRESEEKFRTLAEQLPNMIFINKKGRVVYANKKCEEIMGYKREEFYSPDFNFLTLIAPEYIGLVKSNFSSHMKSEEVAPYEYALITKEGKRIEAIIASRLIRYGEENAILGIVTDITKRKWAEKAIRESQEKFERLFMDNPEAAVHLDLDFHILEVNPRFEQLFGYSSDEIKGKHINDVVAPKDKMAEAKMLDEKARKGYVYHDTFRKKRDGSLVPVSISAAPIIVEDRLVGYIGLYKDITERKQMEEKLRESEEKYRTQFEEALDAIFLADAETGIVIDCNRAALELVGREKSELIGKHQRILHPPEEIEREFSRTFKQHLKEKEGQVLETQVITKKGEIRDVAIKANLLELKGKKRIQGIFRDITERKLMQNEVKEYSEQLEKLVERRTRQLKKAQEQLLRAERLAAIGEVATMVGHDLRNPLQSIENATYYLNNELQRFPPSTPIPQKTMEMLQVINDSINYADRIIRDLQDFSAAKKPILKKTSINAIVKETLSQVEAPRNVKLIIKLGRLPKIKADKEMIKRAFLNLAVNGMQAMKNGGTLKVSTKKTKGFVEASFKDTGIGISKKKMEKLFTPFFTTKAKGMGMGLAICKRFVESHCGSIDVESEERKGSTFTVKLPIQQVSGGEK